MTLFASREMGTQCDIEDMLEPMAISKMNHRMCCRRVRQLSLCAELEAQSIVDFHFCSFRDVASVNDWASMLSKEELAELAHGFLGTHIAGITVKSGAKERPRSVNSRHLEEAAILSENPNFRSALLSSARTLFFGGFSAKPFNGRSLFALVDHNAEIWAPVMYTALDFAGHLIQRGVLPVALTAELLKRSAQLLTDAGVLHSKHIVNIVAAMRIDKPTCQMPLLSRSMSSPLPEKQGSTKPCLRHADTAPADLYRTPRRVRSIGTLLRLQDDLAPYCCISFEGVVKDKPHANAEIIPLDIPLDDVPAYWRSVAGGEHRPAKLEQRALVAEVMVEIRKYSRSTLKSTKGKRRPSDISIEQGIEQLIAEISSPLRRKKVTSTPSEPVDVQQH